MSAIRACGAPSPAAVDGLGPVQTRAEVIERLRDTQPVLDRLGVASLALFGSAARDQLTPSSDIDILVRFAGRRTFNAFMALKLELEVRPGHPMDLLTPGAVKLRLAALNKRDLCRSKRIL